MDRKETMEHQRVGRKFLHVFIIAGCSSPTAAINIWPRLEHMWRVGSANGGELGTTLGIVVALVVMTAAVFKWQRDNDIGSRMMVLFMGMVCLAFNLAWAVDTAGAWRADTTAAPQGAIAKSKALSLEIQQETSAIVAIQPHQVVTKEMVAAAQRASDIAETNRKQECGVVGDNCRKRVAESTAMTERLSQFLKDEVLTTEANSRRKRLDIIQSELRELGSIPQRKDDTADRIAGVIGLFANIGDRDDAEAMVSRWWPIVTAVVLEILAILGPWMIFGAIGKPPRSSITVAPMVGFDPMVREPTMGLISVKHADDRAIQLDATEVSQDGPNSEKLVAQGGGPKVAQKPPRARKSGPKNGGPRVAQGQPRASGPEVAQGWPNHSENNVITLGPPLLEKVAQLVAQKKSQREIATLVGVSRTQVQRLIKEVAQKPPRATRTSGPADV
jgi:hypothetical protein